MLDDQRVNSPFQRFRRHLLLWLQLLILLLLCLAALQPVLSGFGSSDRRLVVMVEGVVGLYELWVMNDMLYWLESWSVE